MHERRPHETSRRQLHPWHPRLLGGRPDHRHGSSLAGKHNQVQPPRCIHEEQHWDDPEPTRGGGARLLWTRQPPPVWFLLRSRELHVGQNWVLQLQLARYGCSGLRTNDGHCARYERKKISLLLLVRCCSVLSPFPLLHHPPCAALTYPVLTLSF